MRRRGGVLVGGLVILLAFGYLLWGGLGENLVYFLTPSELVAKGGEAVGAPLRLGGQVEPGSVEWDAEALDLRFVLSDGGAQVKVHASGAPPQMFRPGIGVVVEGRLRAGGVFEASSLMVKHSNEYRAPHEGERPEQMYETLLGREAGTGAKP